MLIVSTFFNEEKKSAILYTYIIMFNL